jgi:hypothetical protein
MRKLPFSYETEFNQTIEDLLATKKIQPSDSPRPAPVQLVKKADGSLKTTINYKQLKEYIEGDGYSMRFMYDIFARQGNA